MLEYYGKEYFNWQKEIGEFGGRANLFKFEQFIGKTDDVLDFGCGGGYLLQHIKTSGKKIGVEINPFARSVAEERIDEVYSRLEEVPDNSVNVIISNHALEHVENPADILREFKRIIRNNGLIIVVVPHETTGTAKRIDTNMHLYTWAPQNLVNLYMYCGINVISFDSICHMWVPNYQKVQRKFGWSIFHKLCRLYCWFKGTGYQTRVVGSVRK